MLFQMILTSGYLPFFFASTSTDIEDYSVKRQQRRKEENLSRFQSQLAYK